MGRRPIPWRWSIWGLVGYVISTAGCAHHKFDLRKWGSSPARPATLEDQVKGTAWLHEAVGLGPLIVN